MAPALLVLALLAAALAAAYYLGFCALRPELTCASRGVAARILRHVPSLRERYWPPLLLTSGHLQTFAGALRRSSPPVSYRRELLAVRATKPENFDGQVALDWAEEGAALTPESPVLIILHGLTGGSHERYVKVLVQRAQRFFRVCVFNARGCGGSQLVSPQGYCASYTEDIRQAVEHVRVRFPDAPLLAAGYSLGSNILVKYVAEEGAACPLAAAVSFANPFDLVASSAHLHATPLKRSVYSRRMGASLRSFVYSHMDALRAAPRVDLSQLDKVDSILAFDEHFTRQAFGYESVRAYFEDSSCSRLIERVTIPLLCLNARDDPICDVRSVPLHAAASNDNLLFAVTACGGHSMDWFEGALTLAGSGSWSARVAMEFLLGALAEGAAKRPAAAEALEATGEAEQAALSHTPASSPTAEASGESSVAPSRPAAGAREEAAGAASASSVAAENEEQGDVAREEEQRSADEEATAKEAVTATRVADCQAALAAVESMLREEERIRGLLDTLPTVLRGLRSRIEADYARLEALLESRALARSEGAAQLAACAKQLRLEAERVEAVLAQQQ